MILSRSRRWRVLITLLSLFYLPGLLYFDIYYLSLTFAHPGSLAGSFVVDYLGPKYTLVKALLDFNSLYEVLKQDRLDARAISTRNSGMLYEWFLHQVSRHLYYYILPAIY